MMTPSLPSAPRVVLFDLDDTLCDYAGARARRLEIAFGIASEQAGVALDADVAVLIEESIAIHPHSTEHFRELLGRHGIADAQAVRAAREWYAGHRFHTLALFDDAIETVAAARAVSSVERIGLVTNGPSDTQRCKIDLLGIEPYVDFILVSEEFGVWKPEPGIFAEALRLGGAEPGEAIFIGDSAEHDIAGAQAAGIAAIWINPAGRGWDQRAPEPARTIGTLAELRELLAAIR
jgi:putative hydrolase of the HAD superfamily